jgi:hypothetical protein
MGRQIVGAAQFLLDTRIVFRRHRSGQIFRLGRKVLATSQAGLDRLSVGGLVLQQTAEEEHALDTGSVARGRMMFAPPAEPAEQMGVATAGGAAEKWRGDSPRNPRATWRSSGTVAGRRVRARVGTWLCQEPRKGVLVLEMEVGPLRSAYSGGSQTAPCC